MRDLTSAIEHMYIKYNALPTKEAIQLLLPAKAPCLSLPSLLKYPRRL
jgi:hypothetical protein